MPLAKNLALLVIATLVGLGTLELLASLYVFVTQTELPSPSSTYPARPGRAERPDDRLGWSLKPNFANNGIQINPSGFRSSVADFNLFCQDKKVIIVIGDSMVYGYGMNQQYIFTELLNQKSEQYCFINTGVIGYSTAQQLLKLPDYINNFSPDLILWFFTQGNDIWSNARGGFFNPYFDIADGELKQIPPAMEIDVPLYEKTTTYRLLNKLLLSGRDLIYAVQRLDFMVRGEDSHVWVVTDKILERVADLLNSYQIPLVMIDIPSIGSLKRGETNGLSATGSAPVVSIDAHEVAFSAGDRYELLEKTSKRLGFDYVRIWEYYPADFRSIFIPKDAHWNQRGHELVADLVLRVLRTHHEVEDRTTGSAPSG